MNNNVAFTFATSEVNKLGQIFIKVTELLTGKLTLKKLFYNIKKNPGKFIPKDQLDKDKYRAISDFVSGMTDRYAINLYKNLT